MQRPVTETRIVIDISSVSRWAGPAVGIVRVENQLALWARAHLPNAVFGFFDPYAQQYRQVHEVCVDAILQGACVIAPWNLSDPNLRRRHFEENFPRWMQPAVLWVLYFRRQLLLALEAWRLGTHRPWLAERLDQVQRRLMSGKYRGYMVRKDGTRRSLLTLEKAVGETIALKPADILVCAGSSWSHTNIVALGAQKKLRDFRLVILCYDIIPLLFPHYYKDHDVEIFADFFKVAFPLADLVVVTAKQIETDVKAYCADKGLILQCTAIVPLGADAAKRTTARDMLDAHGLEVGRYILFVSTIEPRKGHRLAYQTWRQLLVEGVPQQQGYKLVFVGRPGWLVEDLLADIKADTVLDGTLLMLPSVDDAGLAQLYKNAAFCIYPSHYEGYGLPIIEAFSYGKAVIASTGGALPEVVGEFSPCLDPNEEAAWLDTMRSWIVDEAARAPYEAAIRERFKLTSWNEAAAKFFEAVQLIGRG